MVATERRPDDHEDVPKLLRNISAKGNHVIDGYLQNASDAPTPRNRKDAQTRPFQFHSNGLEGTAGTIPSHVISMSMPNSPAKFEMQRAKSRKVVFADADAAAATEQAYANCSHSGAKSPRRTTRFHSQPIFSGPAYAQAMANINNIPVVASAAKDDCYALFRTRSGKLKLEPQLSRLRGRPPLENNHDSQQQHGPDVESQAVPADRFFDALQGPELEILRESEELVLPRDRLWPFLLRFPISSFGICLGVASQAMLWKNLATSPSLKFLQIPNLISLVLWCLGLVTLIAVFTTYMLKCIFYFEAVRREYYHPVRVNFFFAPWIGCMFLSLGLPPQVCKNVHPGVWCACMLPLLCLELKIYGQWMSGGDRRLSKVANPSNHLAIVGNFVGALLGATISSSSSSSYSHGGSWKEGALFFFAVGLAHYMVLFVTLYQRLPTNETLPHDLHPVFFLFVAAPSVASVAWEKISGHFDYLSRTGFFIALFLYASLVVRLNFFRGFRFSVAWWAYTFPMTGAAIATIRYSNAVKNPVTQGLAVALSAVASVTVLALLMTTILHAFLWGTLFPNDVSIAITTTKNKRKTKKHKKSASSGGHLVHTMLKKFATT